MAFHTASVAAGVYFHARGEDHAGLRHRHGVVAGYALHALSVRCGHSGVHFTGFRAVRAKEVLVSGGGMALGATGRHAVRIFGGVIPMAELLASEIVVTRTLPLFNVRNHRRGRGGSFGGGSFCCCCGRRLCAAASR